MWEIGKASEIVGVSIEEMKKLLADRGIKLKIGTSIQETKDRAEAVLKMLRGIWMRVVADTDFLSAFFKIDHVEIIFKAVLEMKEVFSRDHDVSDLFTLYILKPEKAEDQRQIF